MSLNQCNFIGRLTDRPSGGQTQSGTSYVQFDIAVQRNFKNSNGDYDADFIRCTSFGGSADYLMQYADKGDTVAVSGQMQNNNYTDNSGQKHYGMKLNAREVQIVAHPQKKDESRRHYQQQQKSYQGQQPQHPAQDSAPLPPEPPKNEDVEVSQDDLPFD